MLVGRTRAWEVLRLVLASWCVGWVLTGQAMGLCGPGAGICLLVGGVGAQGILGLIPAPQWVKPGPWLIPAHWQAEPGLGVSGSRAQGFQSLCWTD